MFSSSAAAVEVGLEDEEATLVLVRSLVFVKVRIEAVVGGVLLRLLACHCW